MLDNIIFHEMFLLKPQGATGEGPQVAYHRASLIISISIQPYQHHSVQQWLLGDNRMLFIHYHITLLTRLNMQVWNLNKEFVIKKKTTSDEHKGHDTVYTVGGTNSPESLKS